MIEELLAEAQVRADARIDELLAHLLSLEHIGPYVPGKPYCVRCDRYKQYYVKAAIELTKAKRHYRMVRDSFAERRWNLAEQRCQDSRKLFHTTPCTCGDQP